MPAGDLITVTDDRYEVELRGWLAGAKGTTDWWVRDLAGYGEVEVVDQDVPNQGPVDGTTPTVDRVAPPLIVITLLCSEVDAAGAEPTKAAVQAAFTAGATEELHLNVPGDGHVYLVGRARGVKFQRTNVGVGQLIATAQFLATDPTIYEVT